MEFKLENVSKKIDGIEIIKNVNIVLESGHIYGFIGRNGSGKTMLLKMICGFIKPSTGKILLNNNDIYKKNFFTDDIKALIESPKFINDLSGFDNLKLLAGIQKKITDNSIEEWLKKFGLFSEKDKLYSKYSLGMKQKIGIIQVLMENPNVIILDEPFNGLDEKSVKLVKDILMTEKKNGKLIIISSHIKEDIDYLCDIKVKFENGMIKIK